MDGNNIKTDLRVSVPFYKEILGKLDFAQPFIDDPDLFSLSSATSRNFLIQAFAYIHSEFHYLSFLNKDIDREILKTAEVLQILPMSMKKSDKLFDNLNDSEITKFWSRLFVLLKCKKENNFSFDTIKTSQEKNFDFLKDISKTLDYMHYELPVVKEKIFSSDFVNKEIETWDSMDIKSSQAQNESSFLNYDGHQSEHINIEKLLIDLEQVTSMLKNSHFLNNVNKPEHLEFFKTFTLLTQNIDKHIKNLKEIDSTFLNELHHKMLSEGKLVNSSCLYFLKKCSNFLKILEYRNKFSR